MTRPTKKPADEIRIRLARAEILGQQHFFWIREIDNSTEFTGFDSKKQAVAFIASLKMPPVYRCSYDNEAK